MSRLTFEIQSAPVQADPSRADIACFVGFVAKRDATVPPAIQEWLTKRQWDERESWLNLLDVPIPIDSWDVFDELFAWDSRTLVSTAETQETGSSYLGAAVRSFFQQGGRKCFVVRAGDPWTLLEDDSDGQRRTRISQRLTSLIPTLAPDASLSSADRASWHGIGHLFGLPEVSTLCLPDLPDIISRQPEPAEKFDIPRPPTQWLPCSEEDPSASDAVTSSLLVGQADAVGFRWWAKAVGHAGSFLRRGRREVHLVAALPLPDKKLLPTAVDDPLGFLLDEGRGPLAWPVSKHNLVWPAANDGLNEATSGIGSAFVQVVTPWLETTGGAPLPEQLEPADGVLSGLLARNSLQDGSFRNAARQRVVEVVRVEPLLAEAQRTRARKMRAPESKLTPDDVAALEGAERSLEERLCVFGRTPNGLELLSDVTTSLDDSYRPAGVSRLMSAIAQATRRLGEDIVFESSSTRLWSRMRDSLTRLLGDLYQAGALRGATRDEAFSVRCDRSTMSRSDIDNGRVIAEVEFAAAASIDAITVILAMDDAGQVSLVSASKPREAA